MMMFQHNIEEKILGLKEVSFLFVLDFTNCGFCSVMCFRVCADFFCSWGNYHITSFQVLDCFG